MEWKDLITVFVNMSSAERIEWIKTLDCDLLLCVMKGMENNYNFYGNYYTNICKDEIRRRKIIKRDNIIDILLNQ